MPNDETNSSEVPRLLEQAKEGDEQALSALLQWSRGFLRVEARDTLGPQLRVRVDESDLVQKVCMAAIQELSQFRGASAGEYVLWLRRILERDILEVVEREQDAAKRAVDREVPGSEELRQAMDHQTSPSRRAMRNETLQIVREAINELPEDLREPMRLRHIEGCKLPEIVARTGKSADEVTGLLFRGLKKLKPILRKKGLTDL